LWLWFRFDPTNASVPDSAQQCKWSKEPKNQDQPDSRRYGCGHQLGQRVGKNGLVRAFRNIELVNLALVPTQHQKLRPSRQKYERGNDETARCEEPKNPHA
jgi:hypothetical protein